MTPTRTPKENGTSLSPADGDVGSDDRILERSAERLQRAGLGPVSLLWLESLRPVLFLGAQALHALKPFLGLVMDEDLLEKRIELLEDRRRVARFLDLLEAKGRP